MKSRDQGWLDHFFSQVDESADGCWLWRGSTNGHGYGQSRVFGEVRGAHRSAYELLRGAVGRSHIDHLCRNRLCVNPWHMELVSQGENNRRSANTTEQARMRYPVEISPLRLKRIACGLSMREVAELAGLSPWTVLNAELGRFKTRESTLAQIEAVLTFSTRRTLPGISQADAPPPAELGVLTSGTERLAASQEERRESRSSGVAS